jgi:hypothetical protein
MLNIVVIEHYLWPLKVINLSEVPILTISKVNPFKKISKILFKTMKMPLNGSLSMLLTVIDITKSHTLSTLPIEMNTSFYLPNTSTLTSIPSSSVKINGIILSLVS